VYSTNNGVNWNAVPSGPNRGGIIGAKGVAYGNGIWVIVGSAVSSAGIAWSNDGIIWNAVPSGNLGGITNPQDVAFGDGRWVVVGESTMIAYSTDNGISWTGVPAGYTSRGGITPIGNGVAYGNGRWVVVGGGSGIATSTNGTSWQAVTGTNLGGIFEGRSVAYSDNHWVVGATGAIGSTKIAYSIGGTEWIAVTGTNLGGITTGSGVAFGL
jgi:hypothetical protein